MISLNMFFTSKPGREADLASAIRDKWIAEMSKQPGFIRAVMMRPYSEAEMTRMGLTAPDHTFHVATFWEREDDRAAWAASQIHDEVMALVVEAIESRTSSLQTVEHTWNF